MPACQQLSTAPPAPHLFPLQTSSEPRTGQAGVSSFGGFPAWLPYLQGFPAHLQCFVARSPTPSPQPAQTASFCNALTALWGLGGGGLREKVGGWHIFPMWLPSLWLTPHPGSASCRSTLSLNSCVFIGTLELLVLAGELT